MKTKLMLLTLIAALAPELANAYVGPGAGLSAIGSGLALIFGLFVAILGFIWYPVKRLLRGKQGATLETESMEQEDSKESTR